MRKAAFTLIELSIAIVIIGLLVGSVLVGQDLVVAAKMRNVQSKVQEFSTAVNVFKLKYNCIPGDCRKAYQFISGNLGCIDATAAINGSSARLGCNGNGDEYITRYSEMARFWQHLQASGLIEEGILMQPDLQIVNTELSNGGSGPKGYYPVGPFDIVYMSYCASPGNNAACQGFLSLSSRNFIRLGKASGAMSGAGSIVTGNGPVLSAVQAKAWDDKYDDGIGNTGRVQASRSGWCTNNPGGGTTAPIYLNTSPFKDEARCTMYLNAGY